MYNKFHSTHQAAVEINAIRFQLEIDSSFEELADLLRIKSDEFKEWNLLKMDKDIEQVVNRLERINDQSKIECLKAFANSLEFVEWLRKNAPNLSEFRFLVELASTSSTYNESLSNLDRSVFAKTLKEAGTAYASLIYDLRSQTTFFEFMNICDTVCSYLESDRNIASKLLTVSKKIAFLEEIKVMRGNVELDSLKQAKQINKLGVYRIGHRIDDVNAQFKMQLKVIDENGVEKRTYTLQQLDELQNILMLGIWD